MQSSTGSRFDGLTSSQAAEVLRARGPNLLPSTATRSQLRIILDILREPMLAMLLAAGAAYLLLGSAGEALVLVCFAGFSIVIAIVQESRTEHVLQSLRELAAPHALVIRNGKPVRIPGREVVPGDLLVLEQGDRIPADAAFLECANIEVDESLLTGESVPVSKRPLAPDDRPEASPPGGDGAPWAYSSTMVTRGRGVARVLATGTHTQVGQIGRSLATLEMEAPLLRSLLQGGAVFAVLAILFLTAAGWSMPAGEVRALVFFALVAALLALVVVDRAFSMSIAQALVRGNPALRYIAAGIAMVGTVIIASPVVRELLQFAPLKAFHLAVALATGGRLLLVLEWKKLVGRLNAR